MGMGLKERQRRDRQRRTKKNAIRFQTRVELCTAGVTCWNSSCAQGGMGVGEAETGYEETDRCRGEGVKRCTEVKRCRNVEAQRCRVAEVKRCRGVEG